MKKLDKIILILFSVLILVQSIFVMCLIVGWVKLGTAATFARLVLVRARFI